MQAESSFPQLTKCGEIFINDGSTDAFLFCTFCAEEADTKDLRTLEEFIKHIRWHRSDDLLKDGLTTSFEVVKVEAASDENVSFDADPIQMEPERLTTAQEALFDISDDVLVDILDLYKKCPCLWHERTGAEKEGIVESTYNMLASYFNKRTQQSMSSNWIMNFIERIRDEFLEEYPAEDNNAPWYFSHMTFLLQSSRQTLEESIYTDFECTICRQDLCSQEELWEHLCECHLELSEEGFDYMDDAATNSSEVPYDEVSSEALEKFIDVYRDQPWLWDRHNKNYHNQKLREESHDILLKVLEEFYPDATQCEVLTKIKHIRSKFVYEQRKIQQSKLKGIEYRPCTWYYEKLLFLANQKEVESKEEQNKDPVTCHTCSVCSKSFTNQMAWLDHMQCGHDNNAFQSDDGFFYCPICNQSKKTKRTLIRHIRHNHLTNQNFCQECGTRFRFMSALASHRAKVHHDYHPFKCEKCGKGFANLYRLKLHSITHWNVDDRPHECGHCGAKFSNSANLKVHIRRHTRDFILRCKVCNHTSATTTELRFHMLTHTRDYPCICDVCGKGYRSMTLLTTHKNECHGAETFVCGLCEKEFKSLKKLHYHYETHNPQKDHECTDCGKRFVRSGALRKHMRLKHQAAIEEVLLFEGCEDEDDECENTEQLRIEKLEDV